MKGPLGIAAFLVVASLHVQAPVFAAGVELSGVVAPRAQAVSGPVIDIAPTSHGYGRVNSGGAGATFAFVATNLGDTDLHISGVTQSDPASGFSASLPGPIGPGMAGQIMVTFTPTGSGPVTDMLTVNSDATNGPFTLLVSGTANNPPSFDPPLGGTYTAPAFLPFTFTASATDPEGDALDWSVSSVPSLPPGVSFDHATGTLNWTPSSIDAGTYDLTISVTDGLATTSGSLTVLVTVTNNAPVAVAGGPYPGSVGSAVTFDGTGSHDPDSGQMLTWAWSFGDGNGANGPVVSHPYAAAGTYTASLTVTDDGSPPLSDTATASVSISDLLPARCFRKDQSPVKLRPSSKPRYCFQIEPVTGDFSLVDVIPSTIAMTYGSNQASAETKKTVTISDSDQNGVSEIQACFRTKDLELLFSSLPVGRTSVTASLEGDLASGDKFHGDVTFVIEVGTRGQQSPIVSAPPAVSGSVGSILTINVSASDPDGDAITSLTAAPLPPGATFSPSPTNLSGTLTWMPGYNQDGAYSIVFSATNNRMGTATTAVSIGADVSPLVSAPDTVCFTPGERKCFIVEAGDKDSDPITALVATPLPVGATFTLGPANTSGQCCWTPTTADCGTRTVTFTASNALSGMKAVVLRVACPGPCTTTGGVVKAGGPYVGVDGDSVVFTATSIHPDGNPCGPIGWSFSDGTTALGSTVVHLFPAPGFYSVVAGSPCDSEYTVVTITGFSPSEPCSTSGGWQRVSNTGPAARWGHAMAADTSGHVILFGGQRPSGFMNDTWLWDGAQWVEQKTALDHPRPSPRAHHAMAFDPRTNRIYLFGGSDGISPFGDTWAWDGDRWTLVATSGPSARAGHVMVYDELHRRLVLFGGNEGSFGGSDGTLKDDTWEWDGNVWTLKSQTGPGARQHAAAAYDPRLGKIVLMGGENVGLAPVYPPQKYDDTFEWDGAAWTPVSAPGPGLRSHHAMAYAGDCGQPTLFGGGVYNDQTTWRWRGAEWALDPAVAEMGARHDLAIVYDPLWRKIMVFGGIASGSIPYGDTWELCCPCDGEAAVVDSMGAPVFPSTLDPDAPVTQTDHTSEAERYVSDLYPPPRYDTDMDEFYKDLPCPPAVGGTLPPEASLAALIDSLGQRYPGITLAELQDSLSTWDTLFHNVAVSLPPPFNNTMELFPAEDTTSVSHGLDRKACYVFGGRDLVFVHGFDLDRLFDKMLDPSGYAPEWQHPTVFPGSIQNPAFYDPNGYWKKYANDYWERHIGKFLTDRHIMNRYLVVSWATTQRLPIAAEAVLTQIGDAMRYGTGVVDPSPDKDTSGFGKPSFVVITHSTGGLVTDVAMAAASAFPNLKARFIPSRCKAQVALHAAISGSGLATVTVGLAAGLGVPAVIPGVYCNLIADVFGGLNACNYVQNFAPVILPSVLFDLVPQISQTLYGGLQNYDTRIRTVTVSGGHPTSRWYLKNWLHPGFDDGVLAENSASGSSSFCKPLGAWPSGFLTYPLLGNVWNYDFGIEKRRAWPLWLDQAVDPVVALHPMTLLGVYRAEGPEPHISPTGMRLSVMLESGLYDMRPHYTNHYSYLFSPSDHSASTPGFSYSNGVKTPAAWEYPGYEKSAGAENMEETRVITDASVFTPYTKGLDPGPEAVLTRNLIPRVTENIKGREVTWTIKIPPWKKKPWYRKSWSWWLWKRYYYRLDQWSTKHEMDYVYESVLSNPAVNNACSGRTNAAAMEVTPAAFALTSVFPSPGIGSRSLEFVVPGQGRITVRIFTVGGALVRTLNAIADRPGTLRVIWDGRSKDGKAVAAGVYFVRAQLDSRNSPSMTAQGRIIVLK